MASCTMASRPRDGVMLMASALPNRGCGLPYGSIALSRSLAQIELFFQLQPLGLRPIYVGL